VAAPPAEIDVTESLVRSLLGEQHPDLAALRLVEFEAGWDNSLWRLGEKLVVRLPRREIAAPLARNEQLWLPKLAGRLPLPIPCPVRVGRPSPDYPWVWSVVPWIDGEPGDRTVVTEPEDAGGRLGRFLRALHREAPSDAPHNPYRSIPLSDRAPAVEEHLHRLATEIDVDGTRRVWQQALEAEPWNRPPRWIHGDLHPANILVAQGTVVAVIDFGDVCAGDPATDVGGAWMLLPTSAMSTLAAAYGGVGPNLERRSLGWAVFFGLIFLVHGLDDRPTYEAVGRATLARAIERTRARSS
jgi:aminoglycoside phosphotransferase (APT) family kinase protein